MDEFDPKLLDISIHVPRMRDDPHDWIVLRVHPISIHVPRMRDDLMLFAMFFHSLKISIHVPRMRDDGPKAAIIPNTTNFNPRPSHEGRPLSRGPSPLAAKFQSTSLA